MRVSKTSLLAAVCLLGVAGGLRADYADEVLSDEPVAYWRLGEDDVAAGAFNEAEVDPGNAFLLDGVYSGGVLLEEEGLIAGDPDTAVRFNGIDSEIQIPDSDFVNTGGPFQAKTIELWFQAEEIDTQQRILWEQGGSTRGLHIYVQEVDGEPTIFMSGWNRAQERWEPVTVSTEIEVGVTYHAVLVFDASENDVFGDFDGRITGYLDGEEFDTAIGADQLYAHGDDGAIGGIHVNTWLDGAQVGDGGNFIGIIDEVALYNHALDDPDDDGDFSDSRVLDHFDVGSGGSDCPRGLAAARDGGNVKLTWEPQGAAASVRVVRNGTELAAAAPVDPPEYVDTTATPGELVYELTFNPDVCTLSRRFEGCISDLKASTTRKGVALAWVNHLPYTNIVIQRGDEEIATIPGDQESYVDADVPAGTWTYSVVPENGECEPVTAEAFVFASEYANLVLEDGALAYWRLDEEEAIDALNAGSLGAALDGTYAGNIELGQESLLQGVPDNPSVGLDGFDAHVTIPNSPFTNEGGPWESKTIELWFQADLIDTEPRILYEEGGTTNGFGMYVQEVEGDPLLYMVAWSATLNWDSVAVSTEVVEGASYHAIMVFDASENEEFGDFDGRVTGYLDGEEFGTEFGADLMNNHSNDTAIGAVAGGETQLADSTDKTSGGFFQGVIDEVSLYDYPLDDPDDDGDFSDSRVLDHYLAGVGDGGARPVFHRGDADGDGTITLTDAVTTLAFLFSGGEDTTCKETQDFNNDANVDLTDAVGVLSFLFSGGDAPAAPGPTTEPCGPDPDPEGSAGDLGCASYAGC